MSGLPDSAFKVDQLSVFLENRAGRLAEVIQLLAGAELNIRAISLADTSDFGILRLIASDNTAADRLLKSSGFTTGRTDVLALELADSPGSLNKILRLLSGSGVNVEYMYAYARRHAEKAVMIFRFDMMDTAISLLRREGFGLISKAEIATF